MKMEQESNLLDELINLLRIIEEKSLEEPENFLFNEAAGVMEIIDFEVRCDIVLPHSYKIFLNHFNGGFISNFATPAKVDFETAQWNSMNLFGLAEIESEYTKLQQMNWKLSGAWQGVYPFIPFCRTAIGELLIFVNPLDKHNECPVFDAFHEDFPADWGCLYPDFTRFLAAFVRLRGAIPTTSYESPTAMEFLKSTTSST